MNIDTELQAFIEAMQREHPPARDPNDLAGHLRRYAAVSAHLPSVLVPVTAGDFKLRGGGKTLKARLFWPTGAVKPPLLAWFVGGGWAAGTLDTHDGLCRQLAHDLGVAVACIELAPALAELAPAASPAPPPLLHSCNEALLALQTLAEGRAKLAVHPQRLLAGGDGSGAHHALQAAWRLNRQLPGTVEAVLALYPLVKPDFNTASYVRCAHSPVFSRDDAVRAWQGLLQGRWEVWDERAVLMHGNAPLQRPPTVVLVAAEQDVVHDDAIHLHDWLRSVGAHCEFLGAPRMPHDFARLQHASGKARKLMLDVLDVFAQTVRLGRYAG